MTCSAQPVGSRTVPNQTAAAVRSSDSDEELVRKMIANDALAWQSFVRRYHRLLRAAIRRVLARFESVSGLDVDDAYASLMASLVANDKRKLRSFDITRGVKLSTWLTTLATHAAWDQLRDVRRRHGLVDALRTMEPPPSPVPSLTQLLITREQHAHVAALWSEMNAADQAFVDLLYVQGATTEQIAATLHISSKTVYTKNFKIRSKLAAAFAKADARKTVAKASARAQSL